MTIQQKRNFLINVAYWALIAAAVYLAFKYVVPISVPCILGISVAYLVVRISRAVHLPNRFFRLLLILSIYGLVGLGISWVVVKLVALISGIVNWLPEFYELKLLPFADITYIWIEDMLHSLNPQVLGALENILADMLSYLKNVVTYVSTVAVNLVTGLVTGVPNLILSLLAMIFSTVFLANDYEGIKAFAVKHMPLTMKKILGSIWQYLTETLFVVIRSYVLIMLLTFTELSILFHFFGIEHAVLKAGLIAMLDILPILGTGGIMIPWAITSLVLGYTKLGIQLLVIYIIVTVIRNYVEPKIVGTQLGLHPIITLVSMFIGLRLFGFFGLFGLPVGISFLWKQRQQYVAEKKAQEVQ